MELGLCIADKRGWLLRLNGLFMPGSLDGSTIIFKDRELLERHIRYCLPNLVGLTIKKVSFEDLNKKIFDKEI